MPRSSPPNALYAQAGGVTAVINATMAGVIDGCNAFPSRIGRLYGAFNGILGVLHEQLTDLSTLDDTDIARLRHLPGAALEACRFDLDPVADNPAQYARVLEILRTYNIRYFFYNGGNGSMYTATMLADYCRAHDFDLQVIGIPKTIDNDLEGVHVAPGYPSAAKYLATALLEVAIDLHAMHATATKVLIVETMGRDSGWLTLAGALAQSQRPEIPFLFLFPERCFDYEAFLQRLRETLARHDHCIIVASEGIRRCGDLDFFASFSPGSAHAGWTQYGGVGCKLGQWLRRDLDVKIHVSVPDYLQRSAVHLRAPADVRLAYESGIAAVRMALEGQHAVMPGTLSPTLDENGAPMWHYIPVDIAAAANATRYVPLDYISADYGITEAALDYLTPLIHGDPPPVPWTASGVPDYRPIELTRVQPQLPRWTADPMRL